MSLSQAILDDLSTEAEHTRALLRAVPAGKGEWKPHQKSMSLAELAGHLAETPSWAGSMLEQDLDFETAMAEWKPYVCADPDELVATLDANVAAARAALGGREDAFLRGEWTMRKGDQVLMRSPRHEAIRSIVIHHTAHHRGQLTVYLRLLDVPVPSTYGPTADQPMF